MAELETVLARLDQDRENALERLFDLLRIKSISTDPAFAGECQKAAEWLAADLSSIGFEASVRPTTGHPMVVAHSPQVEGAPHALFYGHYDVQPVDPPDLWDHPPFEPSVRTAENGSETIVARGASDDKGQLMTFVEACRAFMASGGLPLNVTILFEGEEESGSPSLVPFLEANREELSHDFALVCDTGMWDAETPAITTMLRGIVGEEVIITAANRDLHSGEYGNVARNPIALLTQILADIRDEDGKILLDGFYDGVPEIPDHIRSMWDALEFDSDAFLGGVGLSIPAGEKDRTPLEQVWSRPTYEINGIYGGYAGDGFKTVIPSRAGAKVSFRLVGQQDPNRIRDSFRAFVRERLPDDCSVEFEEHGSGPALQLDFDSPEVRKSARALSVEWGREAVYLGSGGSIPIVGEFRTYLGMESVMAGFGLDDDRIHSPNEKYSITSFQKGARSWARIIDALSRSDD